MAQMILGKKVGMTRIFDEGGREVGVSVIQAGPCVVVQRKTKSTDGYEAVQLGFEDQKRSRTNSPMTGHFESRNISPKKHLREFRVEAAEAYEVGQEVTVGVFQKGQIIEISGVSKGKGFAGGMKRHHFRGGPASHGSKVHRAPMSGGSTDPARVLKGTRKPGRMGAARVTTKGLEIVDVDPDKNLLVVKGSVPGGANGLLEIRGRQ